MPTLRSVHLAETDHERLSVFVHRGKANVRTLKRAQILLKLDAGWRTTDLAEAYAVHPNTVTNLRTRYLTGGLDAVLQDRKQLRRRAALTGTQQAHLIAIACSPVPEGHDHWTLRMLAGQAVELGYVEHIDIGTIRNLLKKRAQALAARALVPAQRRCRVRGRPGRRTRPVRGGIRSPLPDGVPG